MLRNLHDSLVDYDLPLLRAIGRARGFELESVRPMPAVEELSVDLLTPEATEWALARLTPDGRTAVDALLRAGGRLKAHLFADRFGAVRQLGSGRLEREKPWADPLNAAEQLWYMGLIFRAFEDVGGGYRAEFVYVPADVIPLLPPVEVQAPAVRVEPMPPPPVARPPDDAFWEDVFGLLATLQMHPLAVDAHGDLAPQGERQIELHSEPARGSADDPSSVRRFDFAYHLCRVAGLIRVRGDRARLDPRTAGRWLKWPAARQHIFFQKAWQYDAAWNDLWHVPSLRLERTGWRNDPLLARRGLLGHLKACPVGEWIAVDAFVGAVREVDPDFARPDGDYQSWYVRDATTGEYLMDFTCWPRVEGALIVHLLSEPLHWLGVTALGYEEGAAAPVAFQLVPPAGPVLGAATPPLKAEDAPAELAVGSDFTILFPPGGRLYERFQLERFAHLKDVAPESGLTYQITRTSLSAAHRQGITPPMIVAFLQKRSRGLLPKNVVAALRRWEPGT